MRVFRLSVPLVAGCVSTLAVAPFATGAEWGIAPSLTWTMDHASNRGLANPPESGQGAFLTFNAVLTRVTPTLQLTAQPFVSVQRYSGGAAQDTSNRSLNLLADWQHEHTTLNVTAGYSDLSTLTTELTTTGVTQGNTHQRQANAGSSMLLQQTERLQLTAAIAYSDVRYVGEQTFGLTDYTYPSFTLGERFNVAALTSLTLSGTGSELRSRGSSGTTRDKELSLAVDHSFSERLTAHASIGLSKQTFSSGDDHGYVGEFLLTRAAGERGQWKLQYQRNVSPNGFGGLVLRDQASLGGSRALAPHLTGGVNVLSTRDREAFFLGLQQARRYESADANLGWGAGETSTVGLVVGYDRAHTQNLGSLPLTRGWRAAVSYTWAPRLHTISR